MGVHDSPIPLIALTLRMVKKIDALIDYSTYREERIRIQKLFRNLGVGYSFLPKDSPNGYLVFEEGLSYQVELMVEDYAHNKTYVSFYVAGAPYERPSPPATQFRRRVTLQRLFVYPCAL